MATYNGEKYLKQQLDSIMFQIDSQDEVLIQDDGSNDSTLDIIRSYKDHRIKLEINSKNLGVIATFDKCIGRSVGDIIILSDQDDIWFDNKISTVKREFASKNITAIVSNAIIIDENNIQTEPMYFERLKSRPGVIKNFWKNSYLGCCLAFRREVYMVAHPFPKNIRTHDGWIGIIADIMGEVKFLDEPLIYYRRHESNVSQMHRFPMYDVIHRRIAMLYNILIAYPKIHSSKIEIKESARNG